MQQEQCTSPLSSCKTFPLFFSWYICSIHRLYGVDAPAGLCPDPLNPIAAMQAYFWGEVGKGREPTSNRREGKGRRPASKWNGGGEGAEREGKGFPPKSRYPDIVLPMFHPLPCPLVFPSSLIFNTVSFPPWDRTGPNAIGCRDLTSWTAHMGPIGWLRRWFTAGTGVVQTIYNITI